METTFIKPGSGRTDGQPFPLSGALQSHINRPDRAQFKKEKGEMTKRLFLRLFFLSFCCVAKYSRNGQPAPAEGGGMSRFESTPKQVPGQK